MEAYSELHEVRTQDREKLDRFVSPNVSPEPLAKSDESEGLRIMLQTKAGMVGPGGLEPPTK